MQVRDSHEKRNLMTLKRVYRSNLENDADTWALFGSIAWQIQEGLITGVNADGTINKP